MKIAKKHPTEEQRLQALTALNILDTLPEKDFDDIALIAAQICAAPMSIISLIDDKRQWFKSKIGLEVNEFTRDVSFCSHTILQDDVLVVNNTTIDERFSGNPLVTGEPGVRFYAGVPLHSLDGYVIGSVCVIDTVERELASGQVEALRALSNQVTKLLQIRLQNEKVKNLKVRAEFKKNVIENLSEGIMLFDKTGKVIECNPAAAYILGLEGNSLFIDRKFGDRGWKNITEEGQKFPESELPTLKCFRTGQKQTNVILGVYRTPTDLRWLNINSVPMFFNEGHEGSEKPSHVITSFSDVTEIRAMASNRRYLEAKLSDSSRLSALGEMAGGIAHEINNPLAVILGKTSLLKDKLQSGNINESSLKDFEKIEMTVERIAKVIKSLKLYSRNADNDPLFATQLSHVIGDTIELCSARFKNHGINIQVNCDPSFEVECRFAQISQLLMNLLNNSFDAVQNLKEKWVSVEVEDCGADYRLVVTDSGKGIPHALIGKIMQPFYSTKEFGKGMGLGLSIAFGIAEGHNGKFEYDSEHQNTRFILTLPKTQLQKRSVS